MNFKFLNLTAFSLVLFVASSTQASQITDLSERDWLNANDGLLTYDASTGLEWLDLTLTAGNSILETEVESFFGEFRWVVGWSA